MRYFYTLLLIIFINLYSFAQPFYGAAPAKRGNGTYRGSIYWVNWDLNDNGRPGDDIGNNITRTVTTPQGIVYNITITNLSATTTAGTVITSNRLQSYVSGQYGFDDMKTGYNWFNSTINTNNQYVSGYNFTSGTLTTVYDDIYDAHNSVVGLVNGRDPGNTAEGLRVTFTITVTATLGGLPIPILGMVAMGAESLGATTTTPPREYQTFITKNSSGTLPQAWQAFDKVQNAYRPTGSTAWASSFITRGDISNAGRTVTMRNASATTAEGPGEMLWFSKGANQIDVILKGGGGQAIAIGFLGTYDFGDAPLTYGTASHELNVSFTGGSPAVANDIALSTLTLATRNAADFCIGATADNDADQWYSADLLGDDTHDVDDEDGLASPYKTGISLSANTASLSIPVKNQSGAAGSLWAWVDANLNGIFEANERSTPVTIPNGTNTSHTLNITLPAGQTFQAFKSYPLRLRVAQGIPADIIGTSFDEGAQGVAVGGEVEDHILKVMDATISGNIFEDVNSDSKFNAGEARYMGTGMYVYLVDNTGIIVNKVAVSGGTFTMGELPVGNVTSLGAKLIASAQNLAIGASIALNGVPPTGYTKTGEDLSTAGSNITNNGNNADFVTLFTGTIPAAGIQNINFGIYPLVLAVNFSYVNAALKDKVLTVNWGTSSETNNKHFEIEVSKDGLSFTKAGIVLTQSTGGHSDVALNYQYAIAAPQSLAALGILSLLFTSIALRRYKGLSIVFILAALSITVIACTKKDATSDTHPDKLFVRIKQVDVDGKSSYSKIIQAIKE